MPELVFLDTAIEDIESILDYITRESGSRRVGREFADKLRLQCRKLASLPGVFGRARPELRADMRSCAFRGYVIFFRCTGDSFEVINVLEGHRDIAAFFESDRS